LTDKIRKTKSYEDQYGYQTNETESNVNYFYLKIN